MRQLNVFTYGYNAPRHIFANIKQFFHNVRFAWQRATRGYCDFDLFDLDSFYSQLFVDSLEDFTKNLHGAPMEFYDFEHDSCQPWSDYIKEMRQHFYNSIEENEVQKNEIEYNHSFEIDRETGELRNTDTSLQNEEARAKWLAREQEIQAWRDAELAKGMQMLEKVYHGLWD